jgi:hypothetical protein
MTGEEIKRLKILKYKTQESLLFFTRYFYKVRYNRKFIISEHHKTICDALERVLSGKTTRLIINISPRYGKTELAVKNFIAHGLALNPSAKFIHLTYAAKLALDNSEESKDIVLNPEYQKLFPIEIKRDSNSKEKWYTSAGGGVYAASASGQVTGFGAGKVDEEEDDLIIQSQEDEALMSEIAELESHIEENSKHTIEVKNGFAGAIIIDDPIKPEDGMSDVKRGRVNERFETTIRNRVNSRKTPIIVVQQRVHEKDLSGYLMDIEPGEWEVVKLAALKEDNSPLWELKHTTEELLKLKRINPYVFESQYQQDPKPIRKGGEAYKLYDDKKNVIDNPVIGKVPALYNLDAPLHLSWDFNVNPHMSCGIYQVFGKRAIKIDEIALGSPRNRTEAVCDEFISRYPSHDKGIFIYGDPAGKHEDTRTEIGYNDYKIIMKCLARYRPELRVAAAAPPVVMRIRFINTIFDVGFNGIEFQIGSNCVKTRNDYMFGKEDSDGTKLKEKAKDPLTGVSYEKHHHFTDEGDYFICKLFPNDFSEYQSGGPGFTPIIGTPKNGGRRW